MTPLEVLIAILIGVGVIGIVVPVLPGSILVLGAILVWASEVGTSRAWIVFAVAATFLVAGAVVKYVLPGRRLQEAGVPRSTLLTGALLGFVGFFVVPGGRAGGRLRAGHLRRRAAPARRPGPPGRPRCTRSRRWASPSSSRPSAAVLAALTWVVGVVVTP